MPAPIPTLRKKLARRRKARDRQARLWKRTGKAGHGKAARRHSRATAYLRRLIRRARTISDVSDQGVAFIASFEGFYPTPYDDPAGYATVGYGHLLGYRPVTDADRRARWVFRQANAGRLTDIEARRLLADSLRKDYEPRVRRLFEEGGPFFGKFEQTFYDALVSAAYNLGPGVVTPGTPGFETIGKAVEAGDRKAVADALLLYDRAGGIRLAGLTRRRRAERRLILTGNYSTEFP
jgi:lysozyme